MITIQPFEIRSVVTGSVWLDGGAMFGVVPKVLWDKVTETDADNRIQLATRTLIAVDRSASRVILVDTGCGTKWSAEEASRFAIEHHLSAIPNALAEFGLAPSDVTDVVVTHLHFDHNGGLTDWYKEPGGKTVLRYPNANHWIHRGHWEHAQEPFVKDRASFLRRDFKVLESTGVLKLVEGEKPPPPFAGIEWWVSHGHTPYQLHPILGAGQNRIAFVGDIAPTVAHLRQTWVMAYDVEPVRTMNEKATLFRRAFDEGIKIAFPHDPKVGGVSIDGTIERPIVVRALDI